VVIRRTVVAAALLASAAPALGDPMPATVRLAWVRGADADACPDGAWLRAEVARRLRRDPFDDDGPRSIEAVVERAPPGWRATLRVRDREGTLLGERALTHDAAGCEPIADASALAIALAVDPDAVVDEPAPAAPPPPPRPRPRPRAPRPVAPPPSGPPLSLGLLVGVSAGVLPSPAPTVGLDGAVGFTARWSARLRVDVAPGRQTDDGRFAFGFTRVTALGCARGGGSLALSLCAGVGGALVHAAVRNAAARDAGDHGWVGATATAGLRWSPSARWFVALEAEAAVALARSRFAFTPDGEVIATQPLLSGGGSVAVGLRSP
jgi:hypothetical protein